MKMKMNDEKGMTLLEIVVAMTLFSIGLLAMGLVIPYSAKKLTNSSLRTSSVTHAQRMIDEAMRMSFEDVSTLDGQVIDPIPGSDGYKAVSRVRFCFANGDTTGANNTEYKRVSITITPKGGREPVTMSTVISKKG